MDVPRSRLIAAIATLVLAVTGVPIAQAGGDVEVGRDGTVVVTRLLAEAPEQVRSALDREVLEEAERAPDVVRSEVVRHRGRCDEVATTVRGGPVEVEYVALRCATERGWEIDLLRSEDMVELEARWSLQESDGGTLLTFSIRSRADLPVPARVQRGAVRRSAVAAVDRLEAAMREEPEIVAGR